MLEQNESLPEAFRRELRELEKAYLAHDDPIRQSGFLGGAARWEQERSLVLAPVDEDGDFLDVGCANGYLLQCLVEWAERKGVALTPYGVDEGAALVELARQRLPRHSSRFWVANAWDWIPPRKFRYVYTLYDCVPESFFGRYVSKLLDHYVASDGILIVGSYGSYTRNEPALDVGKILRSGVFSLAGTAARGTLPVSRVAWVKSGPANRNLIHD